MTQFAFGQASAEQLAIDGAESAEQTAKADALFQLGRQALNAGNFALACTHFRGSESYQPAIGTKLNMAICEEAQGHLADAWRLYGIVLANLAPDDDRRSIAAQNSELLLQRLPFLTFERLSDAPDETTLRLGDASGPLAYGVPLPFDPGRYEFQAWAPGHRPRRYLVQLTEGERTTLQVQPGEPDLPPATAPSPPIPPQPANPWSVPPPHGAQDRPPSHAWSWATWGFGAASLGAAAMLAVRARSNNQIVVDECTPQGACSNRALAAQARGRQQLIGAIALTGGAALSGALGAFLWVRANEPTTTRTSSVGFVLKGMF